MPTSCLRKRSHSSTSIAILLTWLLLLLLPHHLASSDSPTVTITGEDGYRSLRGCARACVWGYPVGNDLLINLGCVSPWYESCLCREDLAPAASSFLSKCVNRDCDSATVDVSQAVSLYDSYCTRTGVPTNAVVVTLDSSAPTTTVIAVTTVSSAAAGGPNSPATGSEFPRKLLVVGALVLAAVATPFLKAHL